MSYYFLNLDKAVIIVIITLICQIKIFKAENDILNTIDYLYPSSIELNNGDFLIVFSDGIYVFNSDITEKITKKEYESGFVLDGNVESDMNTINLSKFDDGVIIAIIKTYLYIFSSTGEYIHHMNLYDDINGANYYSLIPIKVEENKDYYFAITYMDPSSKNIIIYYYKINSSSQTYEKIDFLQYSSETMTTDKGLTCSLMITSENENEMVCFYKISGGLGATSFKFDDKINIDFTSSSQNDNLYGNYKSAVNSDKTKALICHSNNGAGANCIFYDIIEDSFSEHIKYFDVCGMKPNAIHVDYFEQTKEFIFSCSINAFSLSIMKFDSDGNVILENNFIQEPNYYLPNAGYSLFSYSIIFLSKYSQYSVLYTNTDKTYLSSFTEDFKPSHIYDLNEETDVNNSIAEKSTSKYEIPIEETLSLSHSGIITSITDHSKNESPNIISSFVSEEITSIGYSDIKSIMTNDYSTDKSTNINSYLYNSEETTSIAYSDNKEINTENYSINESTNIISSFISEETTSSFDYSDKKEINTENYSINESTNFISSSISQEPSLINSVQIKSDFGSSTISELMENTISEKMELIDTDKKYDNEQKECSKFKNGDIKCLYCNEESLKLNKCIECNKELGYFPILFKEKDEKYIECFNNQTKLSNFYFDKNSRSFNLCYELCNTCDNGGNQNENNCTSCISGYMLNPDINYSTNCIYNCSYYYYYNIFDQYRCTDNVQCPLDYSLLIRDKKKCVSNCKMDFTYQYQYNSECLKKCPENTNFNEFNICEDNDINTCSLSTFKIDLNIQDIKVDNIELSAINFANEYSYTYNHISQFENDYYSFILYKNSECINKLDLNFSIINFRSCYDKIQSFIGTNKSLIISIINIKNINNKPVTIYEIFDPKTGNQINAENICQDDNIIITENLIDYLKNSKYLLTTQKIDIFNLSGSFYTDICYHFESPNKKDVPLKDRILSFYPNISLCDKGCIYKGVNLETYKTECECKIYNFVDNYLNFGNIIFIDSIIGEAISFIKESNILVLKCYKDLFYFKYYLHNKGLYIISSLILIQIICTCIFLMKDLLNIKKYIYNITHSYIRNTKIKAKSIFNPPKRYKKRLDQRKTEISKENSSIINENSSQINKLNDSPMINNFHIFNKKKSLRNSIENNKYKDLSKSNCNLKKNIYIHNKIEININMIKPEKFNFKEYLKTDLDDLYFDEALDKDKRSFCEIFINNIKEQLMIIKTFYISDKIRPRSIKLILFVLNINLYFVANALMYNEEYISELYNSNEEDSFFDFLKNSFSRLLSVSTIGIIMIFLVEFCFVNEKKLKKILLRNIKNKEKKCQAFLLIKRMEKKYKTFIIISFMVTITSWYYIFCFNNVYPNTSLNWIKSSIFIILLVQLISFVYIILRSFMRLISFTCRNEWFYKISKISFDKN